MLGHNQMIMTQINHVKNRTKSNHFLLRKFASFLAKSHEKIRIFTARIRRKVIVSLCVSVHTSTLGIPLPPTWTTKGVSPSCPPPGSGKGVPLPYLPPGPGKGTPCPSPGPGKGVPPCCPCPTPTWTWEGGILTSPLSPLLDLGRGYPHPALPPRPEKRLPPTPPCPPALPPPSGDRRQNSIASTCYAAGGMPLAFTQEHFLVVFIFMRTNHIHKCEE